MCMLISSRSQFIVCLSVLYLPIFFSRHTLCILQLPSRLHTVALICSFSMLLKTVCSVSDFLFYSSVRLFTAAFLYYFIKSFLYSPLLSVSVCECLKVSVRLLYMFKYLASLSTWVSLSSLRFGWILSKR